MKTRHHSTIWAAAGLLALLMSGASAPATTQTPTPPPGKMPQHHQGMEGMGGMMGGPHHVLAMAYRDNLATFARALQGQVARSKTVDLDLARPAVAEMRRSFDQMQQHHQAQMTMMAEHATPPMSGSMQHMETNVSALNGHLTALEAELNAGTPDPKKITEHATEILKQTAGMSPMPAKAKP
jgi:hypothetical protein